MVKTSSTVKSSGFSAVSRQLAGAVAAYLPSLTPGMPSSSPTLAEGLAETGDMPVKVSEAPALDPQPNRLLARLVAAFDWVPCMTPGVPDAVSAAPAIHALPTLPQ